MQQKEMGYGIYGWRRVKRYACRMENIKAEATRRLEILKFWDKHGMAAHWMLTRYPDVLCIAGSSFTNQPTAKLLRYPIKAVRRSGGGFVSGLLKSW